MADRKIRCFSGKTENLKRPRLLVKLFVARVPPAFAVFANPIEEGALETDVFALLLGFDPLVPENFLTLGKEFLIEGGPLGETLIASGGAGRGR